MCDFKPGDQVVCVNAKEMPWQRDEDAEPLIGLVEGFAYTIAYIGPCGLDSDNTIVVRLVETSNCDWLGRDWGYLPIRFRKVQRRDLTAWLKTATKFEEPKRGKVSA